ncbi:hypothetical protein OKA04_04375 [Luteolibacter flavescens]|uniref:Uncharacterized protein n=1 Tax=Luteolibacter flavescens TaxID=1859460 RepID=A0ABT3FK74_9BACT|nr:DUF6580 family putative transport protein [Luteolibacter flavescens]MCW1883951.1 hypothetical protein [Luteolibacter flavescens]
MQRPWIPALVLLALLIAFRCLGAAYPMEMPNFQPLPALFLCSIIFLRGTKAWALPVIAWLVSNPLASMLQGYSPFAHGGVSVAFITLLLTGALALPLRKSPSPGVVIGGGLAAALLFHLVTNGAVWYVDPMYPKSGEGLWQALWSGRPTDVLPTWVFLRNLVAANVVFTALFLLARRSWAPASEAPSPAVAQIR